MAQNVATQLDEVSLPPPEGTPAERPPVSLFRKRVRKFRALQRGYYSFLILTLAYAVSFLLPVIINDHALVVRYEGRFYFPLFAYYPASEFGQDAFGEPNYRQLAETFREQNSGDWAILPLYPYSATESLLDRPGFPPHAPSWEHIFGTDDRARDIFARLAYGFNVSMTFALLVLVLSYVIGIAVGAALGYFGGKLDILGQRLIEVWSSLPFLYTIIIVSSIVVPIYLPGRSLLLQPSFWMLIVILATLPLLLLVRVPRRQTATAAAGD